MFRKKIGIAEGFTGKFMLDSGPEFEYSLNIFKTRDSAFLESPSGRMRRDCKRVLDE